MDREEARGFIQLIRDSVSGFFVKPDTACDSWSKNLYHYSVSECMDAVDHIAGNTDKVPTPKMIKDYCNNKRHFERKREENIRSRTEYNNAEQSFLNVPGANRGEQVAHVCGEMAAEKWRDGERDNEHFGDLLLRAQKLGFEFDGVDYAKVKGSGGSLSGGLMALLEQRVSLENANK